MTLFTLHRGSTSENTRIILNCGPHTLETRAPQPWCAIWSSVGSATPEIKQPDSAKGTPIATGMSSYDDLALLLHLVGMPAARGRRASSFCTQHAKSFAPWLPAPERGIFAHSGSGALGPAEHALVRASHAWGKFTIFAAHISTHEQQLHKPPQSYREAQTQYSQHMHRKRSRCS
jgi:hypothetical protein